MAAKKKRPLTDEETKEMWVCESCGHPNLGVDPPKRCGDCKLPIGPGREGEEVTYFENMYDILGIKYDSTSH